MTLRTPRRRISPRAKRRYRAIKDFLRRALGSSSQPDIKINSSIAINVTDLKHKIVGLEQQLTEVNKHCRELVCLESSSRKESQTQVSTDGRQDLDVLKEQSEITSTKRVHLHGDETKLLYKTSESFYRKSDDSDSISKVYHDPKRNDLRPSDEMAAQSYVDETKIKKKKSKLDKRMNAVDGIHHNLRKHKARSTYENFASSYGATTSYHSLNEPRVGRRRCTDYPGHSFEGHYMKQHEYVDPIAEEVRPKNTSRKNSPQRYQEPYEGKHRRRSKKNTSRELDQEFIADIIKRQYRPIRMFGQRESGVSQFSAPICRDQEYPIRENILEGSDLCSCCFDGRKNHRSDYEYGINDIRSICDTRLYSAMPPTRHKHHRKHTDNYNDSNQYDLVPVKEKSSPKTKRKYTGDAMIPYGYKEVPPSPRSHRPRLNLKAQYYNEFEEYMLHRRQRNGSPKRYKKKHYEHIPESCVDESTEAVVTNKEKRKTNIVKSVQNETHIQQDVATTTSSLQSPIYSNAPANVPDSILNKTQETDSSTDKTDKALNEIKDILQSFLQEIKKETTVSQCDNSEINAKVTEKSLNEFRIESAKLNSSMIPNSGHNMNNYTLPQCGLSAPFMPPFTNPCCYPILPVCPMNCVQNGYAMPSQSFTCASCANNAKEEVLNKTTSPNESTNNVKNTNETDHLIKEIYKFVAQSPINARRKEFREMPKNESTEDGTQGKMTSRSVGGCSKFSRHDAQVETQKIRCQSKSCEAIGSRFLTDTTYNTRTNPSYSDSILERLSLEAATGSESIDSSESTTIKKVKKNKFTKVLRSFGLFKKKRDVIEELSESGSTIEVEVKAKKAPFRQEMMSYMMHEQEYYNRPPQYGHGFGYHPVCPDHLSHVNPMQAQYHPCHPPEMSYHHEQTAPGYRSPHMPSAPPYPNPYQAHHTHDQPQVPLCLKEIEVKSIGTQSDRKMNLFGKFTKKMQGPAFTIPRNQVVEDLQNNAPETTNDKPNLFNWKAQRKAALPFAMTRGKPQPIQLGKDKPALWSWKTLQAKVNQLDQPNSFTYETQKKLAQGDIKMRNAMLKKMFYKRNPFSPRNLIVRTLLGKDKSSYGEPPMMYRPRMFY